MNKAGLQRTEAAKRRKNAAHGASRGWSAPHQASPGGAKESLARPQRSDRITRYSHDCNHMSAPAQRVHFLASVFWNRDPETIPAPQALICVRADTALTVI